MWTNRYGGYLRGRGRFKNTDDLLNCHPWIKSTSFNVWVRYSVWDFKGTLWNSTLLILWKIRFLYNIEILRAPRFKSSYAFWNTSQALYIGQPNLGNRFKYRFYLRPNIHAGDDLQKLYSSIEPVSAFSPANNPGRANENPIWWRWHGNTKTHAILPSADV